MLEDARWAVGWAGGDSEGEDDGHSYLLVANILAGDRGFLSVAGWGWGRALDAQEADGVHGEDTVLPNEDYQGLDNIYQTGFYPLDSRFYRAPYSFVHQPHGISDRRAANRAPGGSPLRESLNKSLPP